MSLLNSIFSLCVFLLHSFSFGQVKPKIALPTKDTVIRYTTNSECLVYTYLNNDSVSKSLTKTIKYNSKGLEVETVMNRFGNYVDSKSLKIYNSKNQLIEQYYEPKNYNKGEISKTVYQYDLKGNLIKQITYTFKRRIRKDVDKGYGRPGGCIITEDDYEKLKTWALETEWSFYYDETNRMTKKKASIINSTQDLYEYKYMSNLKMPVEEISLNSKTGIIYSKKYSFHNDTIVYVRHWFNEDGSRRKDYNGRLTQNYVWYEIYDKRGNLVEKYVYDKDEKRYFNRHEYFYDDRNRLTRENSINDSNKIVWTALYEYRDSPSQNEEGAFSITQK